MSDINLLPSDGQTHEEKDKSVKKAGGDDMALHVPSPEPSDKPAGSSLGGTFLAQLIETEKASAIPTGLFSQKITPITATPPKVAPQPVVIAPLKTPPSPKPAAPPQKAAAATPPPIPPPPGPPKKPELPKATPDDKGSGTLRVSLITANGGAGLSDLALKRRHRTFAIIGLLSLLVDGLIFGGLHLRKISIEKRNSEAEQSIQDVDARIAKREGELGPVRDFQALNKAAARVLDAHSHWTEVLKLLEERALQDVQFGGLAGAETGTLSFDITARDYSTLAKQIVAFRQDPRVTDVSVGTASADFGESGLVKGVRASMSLTIDPSVFRFKPATAAVAAPTTP